MKYFYDCEFLEDGRIIDLISIGIHAEDGREYYAVCQNAEWSRIFNHEFLMKNVVPHLPLLPDGEWGWTDQRYSPLDTDDPSVKLKSVIADEVKEFLLADGLGIDRNNRELWAYYSAYDHVRLCQLWGPMMSLPEGIPMFTQDIKQIAVRLGNPTLPVQSSTEHHALADARHNQVVFDYLKELEASQLAAASSRVACCSIDEDTARELLDVMRAEGSS